jgi:hypothetical protein
MALKNNIVYQKPLKTYQDRLTNQDIKDILKDYIVVEDITQVPLGTHVRYFVNDNDTKKKKFRLGGMITKIDPLGRYIMLSNGQTQPWSVQIPNSIFYKKITSDELKEEIRKEVLTEINTDMNNDLKKKIKVLTTKINNINDENNILKKKNEKLSNQLKKIQIEINKNK